MEGFIYIWRDRWRKMFYIGCHWGKEDDGYICSSRRMRDAHRYRPEDFKRRIIQRGIPREKLLDEEFKWLSLIPDEEIGRRYYNHSKRHFGHWANSFDSRNIVSKKVTHTHTDEAKEKMSLAKKGKMKSEKTKKKMSERMKAQWLEDGYRENQVIKRRGKPRSEETKAKIAKTLTGKPSLSKGKKRKPYAPRKSRELA